MVYPQGREKRMQREKEGEGERRSHRGKNMALPVSDPPRGDERLFKGSGMTKRGAYAAISYMSCAGMYETLKHTCIG